MPPSDTLSLFSLAGTTAVVTGASRGLGHARAAARAEAGADVVCASTRRSGTDGTADDVRARGRRARQVEADLSSPDGADRLADAAFGAAGDIHVLVNNAGTIHRHPAESFPLGGWQAVVQTNVTAVFQLSQRFAEPMRDRGRGKIVNIASLLSFQGGIAVPAYTASKHGVAGLTKALTNEWAGRGMTVNAIASGYFRTDNTQALRDDPDRAASRRGGGASPRTWLAPPSSSPPAPPTTSPAPSSPSMAAGWPADSPLPTSHDYH